MLLNRSILLLLWFQSVAKLRRAGRGFSHPKRFVLSTLAVVLAIVWLGNAALSVLFREGMELSRLQSLVPLCLLTYSLWHVLKVACQRPSEGIEWTPAEREMVCSGPFDTRQLVVYRLSGIVTSAILKAGCFTLLMSPDLRTLVGGFLGSLAALLFVDLVRMTVEIVAHGVERIVYLWFRAVVLSVVGGIVVSTTIMVLSSPEPLDRGSSIATVGVVMHALGCAADLRDTLVGRIAEAPFQVFGHVITATELSLATWGWFCLASAMVVGMVTLVLRLYAYYEVQSARAEQRAYCRRAQLGEHANKKRAYQASGERSPASSELWASHQTVRQTVRLNRIVWLSGIGPILWRQVIGAAKYHASLIFALVLPGVLACLPLVIHRDAKTAVLNVTGALAFYSFLLLPSALKFDFRRDVNRMAVLKSLPLRPLSIVIGQIAAPVILSSLFQFIVLLVAMTVRPYPVNLMVSTMLLFVPMNVLIFGLDNLVFLLYPYRLNQEGIEIFLRTTLTFTAKGLIFTLVLVMLFTWSFAANSLAKKVALDPALVFVVGAWLGICLSAVLTLHGLDLAFRRFDPSRDTPA